MSISKSVHVQDLNFNHSGQPVNRMPKQFRRHNHTHGALTSPVDHGHVIAQGLTLGKDLATWSPYPRHSSNNSVTTQNFVPNINRRLPQKKDLIYRLQKAIAKLKNTKVVTSRTLAQLLDYIQYGSRTHGPGPVIRPLSQSTKGSVTTQGYPAAL